MRITAKSGVKGKLLDLDTGKYIPNVIWFNLKEGSFQAYETDSNGKIVTSPNGDYKIYWATAKLKFIPAKGNRLAICSVSGDFTNVCRCDACTGKIAKRVRNAIKLSSPILSDRCEHYGCTRLAEFSVTEEQDLPPVLGGKRLFVRAQCVAFHKYCAWHYVGPRLLDHRGELIEQLEGCGPK